MDSLLPATSEPRSPQNAEQGDGCSSSLSEIDRIGNEETDQSQHSAGDDTEAETERLDHSTPQKRRRHESVVLVSNTSTNVEPEHASSEGIAALQMHGSDISSLTSSEDDLKHPSSVPSPRKRKRSSYESEGKDDRKPAAEGAHPNTSPRADTPLISSRSAEDEEEQVIVGPPILRVDHTDLNEGPSMVTSPVLTHAKGQSKYKKYRDRKLSSTGDPTSVQGIFADQADDVEAIFSNGEDVDLEDAADAEADTAAKTEEGIRRKKNALDSLSALEKCFARLRDKLFDERLTQANEEIALLEHPIPIHPELLAMKEAIDQRRDQKIKFQQDYLKHKLKCLQRESVATKHQVHAQYMQSIREIRDGSLDILNKDNYQIHRERRSCEEDVPDYSYNFSTKRSTLIKQQTAYNNEISVLSGVAKWVGFPAAPAISQARPREIDDDLQSMGISMVPQIPYALQNQTPALRTTLSAAASLPRQRPAAEERFLDQNPWANPQHPVHQQQRQQIQRQLSGVSRAHSPSFTPAAQRQIVDSTQPRGSQSTIKEPQVASNSSVATRRRIVDSTQPHGPQSTEPQVASNSSVVPTPATGEGSKPPRSISGHQLNGNAVESTLSRIVGSPVDTSPPLELISEKAPLPLAENNEQRTSPSMASVPSGRDSLTSIGLPKPLPFAQIGGAARASPPVRFPIKVEDASKAPHHSPISHQFNGSSAVAATTTGHLNRFAA